MVSNRTAKKRIREILKRQEIRFSRHVKDNNCKIDGSCLPRARYQGETKALELALRAFNNDYDPDDTSLEND